LVPFDILGQPGIVFGAQVCCRPAREVAGALLGCDFPDHVRQAASRPCDGTDRYPYGAGRQLRLV
jgi:hypothetical protein